MMMQQAAIESEHECTPSERRSARRYRYELAAALAIYFATLFLSLGIVDRTHGALKVLVAVLPMAGVLAIALAFVRYTLRADDLQRQTIVVSGAIAALTCATISMLWASSKTPVSRAFR